MAGAAVVGALVLAPGASAATLTGDYQLQGTRASSGPGPALTDIGPGANSFQTDTVFGVSRQVLAFPQDNGVQMTPTGFAAGSTPNSVVTTFRFDTTTAYRRILDYSNGTTDAGIYNLNGFAIDYPNNASTTAFFAPNTYATVAVTSGNANTRIYVNGAPATDDPNANLIVADTLRFFRDNEGGTEASAGAVSCIRVYDGILTDAEVAAIGASPTCGTVTPAAKPPTPPVPVKKKCKKAKKKKRAAEAKTKKKCGKKKRKKR